MMKMNLNPDYRPNAMMPVGEFDTPVKVDAGETCQDLCIAWDIRMGFSRIQPTYSTVFFVNGAGSIGLDCVNIRSLCCLNLADFQSAFIHESYTYSNV